jgi:tetratricopeptide (TPR) repeat protein
MESNKFSKRREEMRKIRLLFEKNKKLGRNIKTFALFLLVVFVSGCGTGSYYVNENYNRAQRLYDRGRYEEAREHYQEYMSNNPDSTLNEVVLYYIAKCYEGVGDSEGAKNSYNKLIDKYKEGYWVEQAKEKLRSLK